jgi:hypothetical protein
MVVVVYYAILSVSALHRNDGWWMANCKTAARMHLWLDWTTIPAPASGKPRTFRQNSRCPAEIQLNHLRITSPEHYRRVSWLGVCFSSTQMWEQCSLSQTHTHTHTHARTHARTHTHTHTHWPHLPVFPSIPFLSTITQVMTTSFSVYPNSLITNIICNSTVRVCNIRTRKTVVKQINIYLETWHGCTECWISYTC